MGSVPLGYKGFGSSGIQGLVPLGYGFSFSRIQGLAPTGYKGLDSLG